MPRSPRRSATRLRALRGHPSQGVPIWLSHIARDHCLARSEREPRKTGEVWHETNLSDRAQPRSCVQLPAGIQG